MDGVVSANLLVENYEREADRIDIELAARAGYAPKRRFRFGARWIVWKVSAHCNS